MTEMETAPLLRVHSLSKAFPGVKALQGFSFDCRAGEIHALIGENGAGKSTLMRILAGVYQPDEGEIALDGQTIQIGSPSDALGRGIAMVYQDTRLVQSLDPAQNIWLAREPGGAVMYDRRAMERDASTLLDRLGENLDLRRPVGELSVAQRQVVEIARALGSEARVLILDEPTSALAPGEVDRLFAILRDLRSGGTAIVFISHRIPEVMALADRITVMKDGQRVGTVGAGEAKPDDLVRMMVGRSISTAFPDKSGTQERVRLSVDKLASPGRLHDVQFEVHAGEVIGLGGIQGSGQDDIARALFGLLPTEGLVRCDDESLVLGSPGRMIEQGVVYVPADRRGEGLFLPHSVRENIGFPHLGDWSRSGVVSRREERTRVAAAIERLNIRTPTMEQQVANLSGGNQQKVVFGRWMIRKARVYIFDEPTQGVDVATKLELYRLIRGLADGGAAVIVISSDVLELIGLCERVLVVADGTVVEELSGDEATEERIVGSAVTAPGGRGEQASAGSAMGRSGNTSRSAPWLRRYGSSLLLLILIALLGGYTASRSPYFLTPFNLGNLAVQIAPLALVALGQMTVMLLGGIDLSVGPMIGLTTGIASYLLTGDGTGSMALGLLACLAAGLAVGLVNGAMIRYLKIPDLITTLSTYSIVLGLALIVRPAPGGSVGMRFADMAIARLGQLPIIFVLVLILYAVAEALQLRGRLGAKLYATGANPEAAFVVGIPTGAIRFAAYLFSAVLAAVAGLIVAARIGSGDPQAGTQFTLTSITATVVGGTSIFGGRGTAVGTFLGAVLVILIQNALNQLQVSAYYQYVWAGLLTLLAVAAYSMRGDARSIGLRRWLSRGLGWRPRYEG